MSRLNLNKNASFLPAALTGVLFWLIVFAAAAGAEMPPLSETVGRLQQIYERTQDFQANFVQETTVKSIRKTEVEEGVVYFKSPRQMLWDYKKPKAKRISRCAMQRLRPRTGMAITSCNCTRGKKAPPMPICR